jgi:hypothetical protein
MRRTQADTNYSKQETLLPYQYTSRRDYKYASESWINRVLDYSRLHDELGLECSVLSLIDSLNKGVFLVSGLLETLGPGPDRPGWSLRLVPCRGAALPQHSVLSLCTYTVAEQNNVARKPQPRGERQLKGRIVYFPVCASAEHPCFATLFSPTTV